MAAISGVQTWLKHNSSIFLTCLSAAGVVATAVMTAKATTKAVKLLETSEDKKEGKLTTLEKFQMTAPAYIPATIVGMATIACIFSINVLNQRQQAALTSAYALVNQSYQEYKNKVKELCGEEMHQKIIESIAKEKCENVSISCPGLLGCSTLDFSDEDSESKRLFYDAYSERYFESTIDRVIQAEYHLNRNFILGGSITLNAFYDFLGLPPVEYGDVIGWSSYNGDIFWIDFNHHKATLDDGLQCYIIDMVFEPYADDMDN